MKKGLIAYYSRQGQNYLNGNIVNLPIGNTEIVAKKIQELTSSELFKIDTLNEYPDDYMETTRVAKDELKSDARPKLSKHLTNLNDYDTIYLGYPNWWGTFPMVVFTFLETYNFSGKTIVPFCTHEGSGLGHSVADIKKCCSGANVMDRIAIKGGSVKNADSQIEKCLNGLK